MDMITAAEAAKKASISLAAAGSELKNQALLHIADELWNRKDEIFKANKADLARSEEEKLEMPLLKRLKFDENKLVGVVEGIKSLVALEEPVGKVLMETELDDGLTLYRESCPIGVIGVIFESRPDALVQIATLCLKSGNAVLLKGGKEALLTNKILSEIIIDASLAKEMPEGWLFNIESREEVGEMLDLDQYIDLIIPRGSNSFVRYIIENSRIPVLGHADGICHGYVHKDAELDMAVSVVFDSKTQYVAVCNAMETLLVHEDIAKDYLPILAEKLAEKNVKLYGCKATCEIIECEEATDEAWATEYLDYELSIKIVSNMQEAIDHINKYGSGHTETIVTNSKSEAEAFMMLVDSGNIFHNCSTRFADGFKYGFGAEVGISTNKIHARGPVGLDGLVIYKYKLFGQGQIAEDYASGKSSFNHKYIK